MDISTLSDKVARGEIDLQPDFQRGQVWSESKRKRLIDTVLRGWYVPAIHIVINEEIDKEEVLDGQQRLRAIIDFLEDNFAVDGSIAPDDPVIRSLDGKLFSELDKRTQSRFKKFTIETVRLREYKTEEPGELFFRLNQLTALTAAEQRNALIGEPRNQIRQLVDTFEKQLGEYSIGFSNARMNFDDTLARLAVALETGRLQEKVTASGLEKRYRTGHGFSNYVVSKINASIFQLCSLVRAGDVFTKLNRASLFSWLFFFADNVDAIESDSGSYVLNFFRTFEAMRTPHGLASLLVARADSGLHSRLSAEPSTREIIRIYNDRASSRVNDVSSVMLRDLCLNAAFYGQAPAAALGTRTAKLRLSFMKEVASRLSNMPADVAERSDIEARLAKQWEARREGS